MKPGDFVTQQREGKSVVQVYSYLGNDLKDEGHRYVHKFHFHVYKVL